MFIVRRVHSTSYKGSIDGFGTDVRNTSKMEKVSLNFGRKNIYFFVPYLGEGVITKLLTS